MKQVAIIGAGPSGMYVAEALLKRDPDCEVTLIERLVSPYGLLRGGVAPDHQKMKSVGVYYERILTQFQDRCHYMGNVLVGTQVALTDLQAWFDAVVIATGASEDRSLGIEGESLAGVYPATQFVSWVNGHPDGMGHTFDWTARQVVVIGQGNVAVDVVRLLAKPVSSLRSTDIPESRLAVLATSQIETIYLMGRRGPVQAAFTELELQELGHIDGVTLGFNPLDFELGEACKTELTLPDSNKARKNWATLGTLRQCSPSSGGRSIQIRFFESPVRILGTEHVTGVEFERSMLVGPPGQQRAVGTGVRHVIPADMVFKSVGYRSIPLPGCPFDTKRHVVPNVNGQVVDENGVAVTGLFVAGWAKRGPSGVLGSNKPCGVQTAEALLASLGGEASKPRGGFSQWLLEKGVKWVTFNQWKQVDAYEIQTGQALGKPREKLIAIQDMLGLLR